MLKKERKENEKKWENKSKEWGGRGAGGSSIKDRDLHSAEYCLGFVGFIVRARLS